MHMCAGIFMGTERDNYYNQDTYANLQVQVHLPQD